MKTFYLKVLNENLNKCEAASMDEAVQYFAQIKQLSIDNLLSLYKVVEKKDKKNA